jgi:hypothetical protein
VFGPIQHFWTENADADALVRFTIQRGKFEQEEIGVAVEQDVSAG